MAHAATLLTVGAATALATRHTATGNLSGPAGLGGLWPRRRTRLGPVLTDEPGEPEAQHREFVAAGAGRRPGRRYVRSMTDRDYLAQALALARAKSADGRHGPFGAVIVRAGAVVGRGWNRVVAGRDPTAHAEIVAIRAACRRLQTHTLAGCTIYCSCEPCPMCLAAILWARLDRVVFAGTKADAARAGFDDARILGELRLNWPRRRLRWAQEGRAAALVVFEQWLANPRRVAY